MNMTRRFVGMLLIAGALTAQEEVATFTVNTREVDLPISVLDKNGKLIPDIVQSAFKVYENNIEQPIQSFRRDDIPVSMGIIIDSSGSMRNKRAKVAAAALALVKNSNPQDEEFIVTFNDNAYLDQPFTSDIHQLEKALDRIDSHGGTSMREAISTSIDYMNRAATRSRKVLLVVTDGNDNNPGGIGLEALVRKAQASEVLVYCIGLLNEEQRLEARSARRALKQLAEASGGQDYYPKDVAEVELLTPQLAHEMRNQYLVSYSPTNPALDGTFRQIKVKVLGYEKATVRTRSGYYASAESSKNAGVLTSK
jgi:Ca-activated chloride channel homolog